MKTIFRIIIFAFLFASFILNAQDLTSTIVVHTDADKDTISKFIYSQFAEHLGRGIYGGIWVGEDSPIPNTRGIRNDVVDALKKIHHQSMNEIVKQQNME